MCGQVRGGQADAREFKLVLGHCGWAPVQLNSEIRRNVWFAATESERATNTRRAEGRVAEGGGSVAQWAEGVGRAVTAELALQHGSECSGLWPSLVANLGGREWRELSRFEADNKAVYHHVEQALGEHEASFELDGDDDDEQDDDDNGARFQIQCNPMHTVSPNHR